MKVLWVCNIMLPMVATYLGQEVSNKEGWLTGLADMILQNQADNQIELAVAFPILTDFGECKWKVPTKFAGKELSCYGFVEDVDHPENYAGELESQLKNIVEDFVPDVVHCFGTEYSHTLAVTKVCNKDKVLIGVQGVCELCAEVYQADLPLRVIKRITFRDWLKKDDILKQQSKFFARGKRERETIINAGHITGRTALDKGYVEKLNPNAHYYFMNETLRRVFYEGEWDFNKCEKESIFLSQGDYPLKGLHYMLKAMPEILEKYPNAKIYVAGNRITDYRTLKDKIKISSYGKYILELINEYKLKDKVSFLGKLSAEDMKAQLLKCNLFVCASALENSPNSLGEAMLLGVPCVSAEVGGVSSIFINGEDGITYPGYGNKVYDGIEDIEAAVANRLALSVLDMWSDKDRMLKYAQNARRHAKVTHNGQTNYERLLEIYREIIS